MGDDRFETVAWEVVVTDTVESLVLDLLEWIGPGARPYDEVLDAWRTSCPRLPIWEAANEREFVVRYREPDRRELLVSVSPAGEGHLREHRPGALVAAPPHTR